MARQIALALALFASVPATVAYSLASSFTSARSSGALRQQAGGGKASLRMESFGLDFAVDIQGLMPNEILGEANIKEKYVPSLAKNGVVNRPFLTEDYPLLDRVAEMGLLTKTADAGLLSALTAKGLTLSEIEKLLPLIEELGLISFAVGNKQFLLNLIAPLLVEPAPLLLGPLAAVLKNPAPVLLTGVALGAWDATGVASGEPVNIPLAAVAALVTGLGLVLNGSVSLPVPSASSSSVVQTEIITATGATGKMSGSGGGQKGLRI